MSEASALKRALAGSKHFKYVIHSEVPKWEALGWRNTGPAPGHHGVYSCILIWPFEGEAKTP